MQLKLILSTLSIVCCVLGAMAQNSIYVAPNSSGNGTSWQNPSNIQDAISNASTNDTIKLKEGVYMISTTLNIEDQLNILGGYSGIGNARDPHTYNSILDGGNQVSMVHMTIQSNESTIDGVYFEKGFGTIYAGGLTIYGSRVKVLNCVFRNNVSESTIGSAAVYIRADEVLIENSLFENNQVIRKDRPEGNMGGAAIHIRHHDNTRIVDCEFINNTSYYSGGAISSWGPNTSIENCLFAGNHTQEDGGAIYINFDDLSVTNCVFTNNTASENGGALFNNNGQLKVSKSVLKDNSASSNGGGLYGKFNEISLSKVSFENNQASLQGGAIYCSSSTIAITDAIFWNNKASTGGGAIYNGEIITLSNIDFIGNNNSAFLIGPFTTNTLYNSIFYNNTSLESLPGAAPDIALQEFANPNSLSLEIVQNILQESPIHGIYHDNLIGIDPYFIDESTGDFNLQHASPAIDAGKVLLYNSVSDVNAGISEDLAGNNRLTANNIDIGAYEYSSILNCTKLSIPLNNSADVAIDTDIQWEAIAEATGYRISIGTTSGGTDIADNLDVGDVTSYSHPSDFPEDTTIYVSITPYNEAGDATACSEEQFTTEKLLEAPSCTQFISPIDGESDVALNAVLQWEIITDASGYRISLGTTSGGTDIADNLDVGDVTSYSHPSDFPEDTTIYVSITPYNEAGDATACSEEQFTTEKLLEAPSCTQFISPIDGESDVALNAVLQWDTVTEATGYRISLGTTSGGTDIADNLDVGDVTSYSHPSDFPEDTTIYVSITPYNEAGDATTCSEEQFTTEKLLEAPPCTWLISPIDGESDVALNAVLQWDTVTEATGYRISIGTISGGTDIADNLDVGNVTSYSHPIDFPEDTTIYVSVTPYNEAGDATTCSEEQFTTEKLLEAPPCTRLISPIDGESDVALNAVLQWDAVTEATGYRISIGTISGGTDIADNLDVGNVTSYSPPSDFPEDTTIYVSVTPYNEAGEATTCSEEQFTTEKLLEAPPCARLISPIDGVSDVALNAILQWDAVTEATGYRISIGTTSGGIDITDNLDVGNVTSYSPPSDFPEDTTIYVSVTPYNEAGEATTCSEVQFTTEVFTDNPIMGTTQYGISPNGDSINDFWVIEGIENYPDNMVTVFNRWGDMVFQVQGYDNQGVSFHGIANKNTVMGGGKLPSGTYFFKIDINSLGNSTTTKGFIVLKR